MPRRATHRHGELFERNFFHLKAPTELLVDVSRLVKSNDRFLSVVECLVQVAVSDCPEALAFLELRRRGGLRARLLGWLLGRNFADERRRQ
jgi:hypothetical protein